MLKSKIELEFMQVEVSDTNAQSYLSLIETVTEVMLSIADSKKLKRISLAVSTSIFPQTFIDRITKKVYQKNIIPHISLSGFDENILNSAKEIGLEKYLTRIEKLGKMKFDSIVMDKKNIVDLAKKALKTKRVVAVTIGPNNVHDILDSLKSEH